MREVEKSRYRRQSREAASHRGRGGSDLARRRMAANAAHGDVAYSEDRYGEALIAFESARDRDPNDPSNWSKIADCHMAMGDLNGCESVIDLRVCRVILQSMPARSRIWLIFTLNRGELSRATLLNEIALSDPSTTIHSITAFIGLSSSANATYEAGVQGLGEDARD